MIAVTTKHRGKMEGIASISTSTINNDFCRFMSGHDFICSKCYGARLEKRYLSKNPNSNMYFNNSQRLSTQYLSDTEIIDIKNQIQDYRYIRLHAIGELINMTHLNNFIRISTALPNKIFGLWTKRIDLVRKLTTSKPDNLLLIYSTPKINNLNPHIPDKFDKVFSIYTQNFIEENNITINCDKKCFSCLKCYSCHSDRFINEIIKGK